jgi:4-amino-4-deoxy-L-arabinose transferase-like glycosyltransferase
MAEVSFPLVGAIPRHESWRLWLTGCLLGVSALTLFLCGITNPRYAFYDESQYVDAARAFLADAPNSNPEAPPLGKLLVSEGISVFGDNSFGWRVAGSVLGALTLVAVYFWAYLLVRDSGLALTAALLTLFNNFLYVMSRVAMMDIYLVAFAIFGLLAFTMALELDGLSASTRRILLGTAGTMFGFACACKWNGIDTLGVVILVSAGRLFGKHKGELTRCANNLKQVGIMITGLCLLVAPVVAYSLTYWPLCRSLHRPFTLNELLDMNLYIWRFHRHVPGNPAIASKWYSWPLQVAPQRALSYLVGNWVVMWGGLLALAACTRRMLKGLPETLLVLLYAGNLLQWAVTPQTYIYYYYYFPCAMFLGIAIPVALRSLPQRILGMRPALLCLIAAACVFMFCLPHMAHLGPPFDCALGCWP